MPRMRRIPSKSNAYHIIMKGIDDQDIFYDDQDRKVFLEKLLISKKMYDMKIYSYCLMTNHIHMVIKIQKEFLSKSIQSLMIKYVRYFNNRYDRSGPLLQNRFKSKNIEDRRYFLEVSRYVHRNPENAGLAKTENYKWSSYQEYLHDAIIIDREALLHYFDNNIKDFINYTLKKEDEEELAEFAENEIIGRLKDENLLQIIMKMFDLRSVSEVSPFFQRLSKEDFKKDIQKIKKIKGTSIRQIARIIRKNRKQVEEAWN